MVSVTKCRLIIHRRHADAQRGDQAEPWADFEAELKQFNGEQDHAHYPPKVQLSKLADSLKDVSSRRLHQEYNSHVRRYLWDGHFWSG